MPDDLYFPPRELEVMGILWRLGSATVSEVRDQLDSDLAYTSVLSALQSLEDKGHVRHEEEGRAYRYIPVVGREEAGASALHRLVRKVFRGSPELLLTQLVGERTMTPVQLERMKDLLEAKLRDGDEG
jgi:predicted transcriptional regulator